MTPIVSFIFILKKKVPWTRYFKHQSELWFLWFQREEEECEAYVGYRDEDRTAVEHSLQLKALFPNAFPSQARTKQNQSPSLTTVL